MTPNFPELKRLNMWVQEQDKLAPGTRQWRQAWWVTLREDQPMCKTAYCVAGAAVVRAGNVLTIARDGIDEDLKLNGNYTTSSQICDLANKILGIEAYAVEDLYDESNNASDVDRYIHQIFEKYDINYDSVEPAPDMELVTVEVEE